MGEGGGANAAPVLVFLVLAMVMGQAEFSHHVGSRAGFEGASELQWEGLGVSCHAGGVGGVWVGALKGGARSRGRWWGRVFAFNCRNAWCCWV